LARFYRALFTGGVFADPVTADVMLTTVDGVQPLSGARPLGYRMGIWIVEIEGFATYRHTGFFGTLATYVPELDLIVTVTTNQNQGQGALNRLALEAIKLVAESRE
jgi:CubicO group peptidase (beta-lactamase class C family)